MAGPIRVRKERSVSPRREMGSFDVAEIDGLSGDEEEDVDEVVQGGEEVLKIQTEECRKLKRIGDPRKPSEQEVAEHMLSHLPYRNWCAVCVRAKGRDLDHRKEVGKDREVSEYAFDYCFPGDELGFKLTVLVGKERLTGMNFGVAVPMRGSSGRFGVDEALEFITECGDVGEKVIIRNDQEPSIQYFIKDLAEGHEEGRTLLEESPVGSSGSNGSVERGVQWMEGHIRVLLLSLEARIGKKVDPRMPIVAFIPEYAAYLMNRLEVGKDGKTGYEKAKGKRASVLGVEFGEKLLYKVRRKDKMAKIEARWDPGIFVGIRGRSGEIWVAVRGKVFGVRSVRRLPLEDRWENDCLDWVDRVPWNRYHDAPDADGDLPEGVVVEEPTMQVGEGASRVVFAETRDRAPREIYIRKGDAEKHGYTRGCAGCSSWHRGLGKQPHTEGCRERFRGLMKEEARVKNAKLRREEFEVKEEERKRRKKEKKGEKKKG